MEQSFKDGKRGTIQSSLINAIINRISGRRNEGEFSTLFGEINKFCVENEIDLNVQIKHRRARTISTRFKNCLQQFEVQLDNVKKQTMRLNIKLVFSIR